MQKYPFSMRVLHWLIALGIIGLLIVGFIMEDMEKSDLKYQIYGLHKSVGMTVLALVVLRWLVRITADVPILPEQFKCYERALAKLTYMFMYLAMLAMPLSGYLMSVWGGHPVAVFGYMLPEFFPVNPELGKVAYNMHGILAWVWVGLISLHVLGYLKHLIMDKVNLLKRMI